MRFRATVLLGGKTATGMEVPDPVVEALGAGKRPAVRVQINSFSYRTTVAVMGGKFLVPLSAENRAAAGVHAGDEVDVDLELDTEPRVLEVPDDLAAALAVEDAVRITFDKLSYSRRRQHVLAVEGAKTAKTRQRRIVKAVETLRKET